MMDESIAKREYTTSLELPGLGKPELIALGIAANNVALRFKAPIYLVGSSITKKDFLDIDIVMLVEDDEELHKVIGDSEQHSLAWKENKLNPATSKWARFIWKQAEYFEKHIPWSVDFKVMTKEKQDRSHRTKPRIRLDMFEEILK